MAFQLPGWIVSGAASARDKARESRGKSLQERLADSAAVCETAAFMLSLNAKSDRVLAYVDPVPESTRAALRRLREEAQRPWSSRE